MHILTCIYTHDRCLYKYIYFIFNCMYVYACMLSNKTIVIVT